MVCNHSWVGPVSVKVGIRLYTPRGQCKREVPVTVDEAGDLWGEYDCAEDAELAAKRLAIGFCSECGALKGNN